VDDNDDSAHNSFDSMELEDWLSELNDDSLSQISEFLDEAEIRLSASDVSSEKEEDIKIEDLKNMMDWEKFQNNLSK
jgi:hypothetical protein